MKQKHSIKDFLINNALVLVVVTMVVFTVFKAENFLTFNNLKNIVDNVSLRFIIAIGISGILIIKGTDLSAGRIVGLSAVIAGGMMQITNASNDLFPNLPQQNIVVGFIAAIAVAMIFGLFNGLIVSYLQIPPFIATLGTQIIVFGLNQLITGNRPMGQWAPAGQKSLYSEIGTGGIVLADFGKLGKLTIPWLLFFAVVIGILMSILYNRTKHGKYMYAIGGNEVAAEVSGVNTTFVKIKIFVLASVLYGIAGFLLAAKTGSTSAAAGAGYELEAIASATIGGVSTSGGVGSVHGVLLGVVIFELLKIVLQFLKVDPNMTLVFQGLVIIASVALDVRKSLVKK